MARAKYTAERKIQIAQAYLSGEGSYQTLAEKYGVGHKSVQDWVMKYREQGEAGFASRSGNARYSSEFKYQCVEAVLRGEGSVDDIVAKYHISDRGVLRGWIQRYHAHKELKDYTPNREIYTVEARRKATPDERKEIAAYCLAHDRDYKGTAAWYHVSYSQVYTWVKKYLEDEKKAAKDCRELRKHIDQADTPVYLHSACM